MRLSLLEVFLIASRSQSAEGETEAEVLVHREGRTHENLLPRALTDMSPVKIETEGVDQGLRSGEAEEERMMAEEVWDEGVEMPEG